MKKYLLLSLFGFCIGVSLKAQTFTDNFDSYTSGSKLGPQSIKWTTWSGNDGGADDALVVSTDAHSGANSLYLSSTNTSGGSSDIILPFGGEYNTGQFTFQAWFKIPNNKTAYFNLQGNDTTGKQWSLNCNMNADSSIYFYDANGAVFIKFILRYSTCTCLS